VCLPSAGVSSRTFALSTEGRPAADYALAASKIPHQTPGGLEGHPSALPRREMVATGPATHRLPTHSLHPPEPTPGPLPCPHLDNNLN
jgi:hypothetical protein